MIRIHKGQSPKVLKDNANKWTLELLEYLNRGQAVPETLKNKYNKSEVRHALRKETFSKCMYCESKISHVAYDHIEHIKPKAKDKYPELTFEWQNLGLACPLCNINKGDDYDEKFPFINPYVDEPSKHFFSAGFFIYHRPGDGRAELSEKQLELNRVELIERRKDRVDSIRLLADRYVIEIDPKLKKILLNELAVEIQADKPYSMCATSIFHALLEK